MTPRRSSPLVSLLLEGIFGLAALVAAYLRNWPACFFCLGAVVLAVAVWTRDGGRRRRRREPGMNKEQTDRVDQIAATVHGTPDWEDFMARLRAAIAADPTMLQRIDASLSYDDPEDEPEEER